MPPVTYSTYDAKARLSEIIRRVRDGQRVHISYRGQVVAEVRPVYRPDDAARVVKQLEDEGILAPPSAPDGPLAPVARRPGALQRFLDERQ